MYIVLRFPTHDTHSVTKVDVLSVSKPNVNFSPITLFSVFSTYSPVRLTEAEEDKQFGERRGMSARPGVLRFCSPERGKAGVTSTSPPPPPGLQSGDSNSFLGQFSSRSPPFRKRVKDADCNTFLAQELGSQKILTCLGQISGFR